MLSLDMTVPEGATPLKEEQKNSLNKKDIKMTQNNAKLY
jgi:hypothetical protein